MKIESGKYYRTRDGRKAYVADVNPFMFRPSNGYWAGFIAPADPRGAAYSESWSEDGRAAPRGGPDEAEDLVAEWVPTDLKAEVAELRARVEFLERNR